MAKKLFKNVCEEHIFSSIYNKYAKDLHDFLFFKFGEKLQPEDKMQEAFVILWQNCKKVTPDKAKSFLFTTANNLMFNEAKHQKVVLKYEKRISHQDNIQDPQFVLEEKEYLKKYQKALAQLTDAQRVAFLMNKTEGKRHKEIAEILGISQKAVEKRIYGALDKLRKYINEI